MPCDYRIDKTTRTVYSRGYGLVTEADLGDHRERMTADPGFDPGYNQLYDFSEVTDLSVTSAFLQRFASRPVFEASSKRALVTPDDAVYGNARAFLAWGGSSATNIRIFRNIEEARLWLGLR